jgi:hypothetical protein
VIRLNIGIGLDIWIGLDMGCVRHWVWLDIGLRSGAGLGLGLETGEV